MYYIKRRLNFKNWVVFFYAIKYNRLIKIKEEIESNNKDYELRGVRKARQLGAVRNCLVYSQKEENNENRN